MIPDQSATPGSGRSTVARLLGRLRRDPLLAVADLAMVVAAYVVALVLRFDGSISGISPYWRHFWLFLPVVFACHLTANLVAGLYGQMWRYASIRDARRLIAAWVMGGTLVILASELLGGTVRFLPLSVSVVGATLSLLGFGVIRFWGRLLGSTGGRTAPEGSRILVMGAGEAGAMVLRDLHRSRSLGLLPVGIVDDDPRKVGRALHGVAVMGRRSAIPLLVERLGADQVLLAIPSANSDLIREVAALCEEADVRLRVLPSVREVVGGRVSARDIRDLRIDDLLGREQVETDLEAVAGIIRGRRVLVTGGGGSIGGEIARQVLELEPSVLFLLDHDETHLHDVLNELGDTQVVEPILVDVRDGDRVLSAFSRSRPDVVFHAAAHKHVPILEVHPEEALSTNVVGTANVADAAVATDVERFVLISTDKAVKPVSAMGASKWFAEQIVRSLHWSGSIFCAVRFGNVLGSRGSVIPTFLQQIARGGPVTVTDPSMTRYFMSVQEAVQLVLQAAALAAGGEVFTLDMGQPINILDLARKVIRLSGRVPGKDVPITVIGRRPGEKLEEELMDGFEDSVQTAHPSIMVSRPTPPDPTVLRRALRELETFAVECSTDEISDRLKALAEGPLHAIDVDDVAVTEGDVSVTPGNGSSAKGNGSITEGDRSISAGNPS